MSMMEKSSISTSTTGVAFKELDIALKKIAKEQEEPVSVEMTLPGKKPRARSLSRNNTETLPDENVTISLPGFTKLKCHILPTWSIIKTNMTLSTKSILRES